MPLLRSVVVGILLIVSARGAFSQSSSTRIPGVSEPPELTGEPRKLSPPNEDDVQFSKLLGNKTDDQVKAALPQLNEFIKQHPNFSSAYFLRATLTSCKSDNPDYASISNDVKAAMSNAGSGMYNDTDYYSLLGKVDLATGKYEQAIADLEKAMSRDLSSADKIFNIGGVEPKKESDFCTWNLTDLGSLVAKFPMDYRPWVFRGLYYEFFTTFGEEYYSKALSQFQHAALLNPRSPLPPYFIGELSSKASFWTKKAWASDAGRDEISRNAVQAYTKAIQVDPKFLPAYEMRASSYLNLKDYPQAIKDYDKVLALDLNNSTAFSDRGIAKLETKQYFAAISDFGDSIRLKGDGESFLPELYEYRGDAHVGLGLFRDAISDYSKSIERRLANGIILFSLKQFRALYPEYDNVSDEVLCRKLNALFFPAMEYGDFANQLMEKNGKWQVSLLNDLYEKRGDTYLKSGDFRRGVLDFNRIYKGIPNFADVTERWRPLGAASDGQQYYLDVKTAEFPINGPIRIWIKAAGKKETNTTEYEIDCKSKRLNDTGSVTHDSNGKVVRSSDTSSGWQRIVPDTIGEQFYNGACAIGR
jgi:tetratricopeptide (TPR) repeat protein